MLSFLPSHRNPFRSHNGRKDPAAFNQKILQDIWGETPQCLLVTNLKAQDFYHILLHGPRGGSGHNRTGGTLLSSVYNACPLSNDAYAYCPYRQRKEMQFLFLNTVYKKIANAINQGSYQQTDIDKMFLHLFYFSHDPSQK